MTILNLPTMVCHDCLYIRRGCRSRYHDIESISNFICMVMHDSVHVYITSHFATRVGILRTERRDSDARIAELQEIVARKGTPQTAKAQQ